MATVTAVGDLSVQGLLNLVQGSTDVFFPAFRPDFTPATLVFEQCTTLVQFVKQSQHATNTPQSAAPVGDSS